MALKHLAENSIKHQASVLMFTCVYIFWISHFLENSIKHLASIVMLTCVCIFWISHLLENSIEHQTSLLVCWCLQFDCFVLNTFWHFLYLDLTLVFFSKLVFAFKLNIRQVFYGVFVDVCVFILSETPFRFF